MAIVLMSGSVVDRPVPARCPALLKITRKCALATECLTTMHASTSFGQDADVRGPEPMFGRIRKCRTWDGPRAAPALSIALGASPSSVR